MKILHISDILGDEVMLAHSVELAQEMKPDVVVCTGDIAGRCLEQDEESDEVEQLGRAIIELNREIDPNKYVNGYVDFDKYNRLFEEQVRALRGADSKAAEDYHRLTQKFDREAERQYGNLLPIFAKFSQPVLTVPGELDSQPYFNYFAKFDIHGKMKEIAGVNFMGLGKVPGISPFVPITRVLRCTGEDFRDYFTKEEALMDADVFVTHVPPKGILDDEYNQGSEEYRKALLESGPDLALCGHALLGLGHKKLEQMITVVNPGNLGAFLDKSDKGSFALIEYDGVHANTAVQHGVIGTDNEEFVEKYGEAVA